MNNESLLSRYQSESDYSGSSDADVSKLGSFSLNKELRNIGNMPSVLKECQTEKRNSGRLRKNASQLSLQVDFIPKIIEYLDTIYDLNIKIVAQLDTIHSENRDLRKKLNEASVKNKHMLLLPRVDLHRWKMARQITLKPRFPPIIVLQHM